MSIFHTINPTSEEKIAQYTYLSKEEINKKVAQSYQAWLKWKTTSFSERAKKLLKLADLLRAQKDHRDG